MSDSEKKSPDETGNLSAIESISNKLIEVTRLAEKLDAKLSEAGAKNRGSPENLETRDSTKQNSKVVGDSLNHIGSSRLVNSTASETLKQKDSKENVLEVGEYFLWYDT